MFKNFLLLLLSFVLFSNEHKASAKNYSIQILVKDHASDSPLENAEIWLQDQLLGITNTEGEFIFSEAIPGARYTFTVRKTGYELKSESRFAKEEMNKSLGALSLRKLSTLIDTYQELLRQDSPDIKRRESLYNIIITSLDAERNLKVKNEFLAANKEISKAQVNPYKENMEQRDSELKPIVKDNLDKLTEFKR